MKKWIPLIVMILLSASAVVHAAVPQAISYQGILKNASGNPVNGTVTMTFSLYVSSSATSSLWSETQPGVSVTNGRYSVMLGSASPITLLFDQQYWLGVKVGSDPEMTPRVALVAVPYAMHAAMSDAVTAGAISATSLADGTVSDAKIISMSASKLTGSIPVSQVAGAASLYSANTFTGDQGITGNLNVSGSVAMGGGTPITQHLSAVASLTYPGLGTSSCTDRYVKLDGAADGDVILLGLPALTYNEQGALYQGFVRSPGIVTLRKCATFMGTGPITLNVRVDVWKHTNAIDGTMPVIVTSDTSTLDIGSVKVNQPGTSNYYQYGNFTLTAGTMNNTDAVVSSATITGDPAFSIFGGCLSGAHIAPGASCVYSIMFTPMSAGTHTATMTILSNSSPITVAVTGFGTVAPEFQFDIGQIMYPDFGYAQVGTLSPTSPIPVGIRNTGTANLVVSGANINLADFSITSNTCTAPVPPQASCSLGISFTPTTTGSRSGTLTVLANDAASPHTMMVGGTGGTQPPFATAETSTTGLDFGSVLTGQTGGLVTFDIANNGNVPLNANLGVSNPEFWINSGCGPVSPGKTCTVNMSFHPTGAGGVRNATLTITDNAANSPQTVSLTARAVAPVVQLLPMDFGSVVQGATATQTLTVTNSGDGDLLISGVTITGDYSFTSNCTSANPPLTVSPGQSCQVILSARPTTLGSRPGSLVISDNAGTGSQTVPLSVNGIPGQSLTVTPASLSFANIYYTLWHTWSGSPLQTITVTASGTQPTTNIQATISPDPGVSHFVIDASSTCSVGTLTSPGALFTLDTGTSCVIGVWYNNNAIGTSNNGQIYISSDGGTAEVMLGGSVGIQ